VTPLGKIDHSVVVVPIHNCGCTLSCKFCNDRDASVQREGRSHRTGATLATRANSAEEKEEAVNEFVLCLQVIPSLLHAATCYLGDA
jgi:hypothetical protein